MKVPDRKNYGDWKDWFIAKTCKILGKTNYVLSGKKYKLLLKGIAVEGKTAKDLDELTRDLYVE